MNNVNENFTEICITSKDRNKIPHWTDYIKINQINNVIETANTIVVFQDCHLALKYARTKKVIYLTFEKEKCDFFNSNILKNPMYGSDDIGYYIPYNNKPQNIIKIIENVMENIKVPIDLIIGNPPYNGKTKLYLRILNSVRKYSENIIWLCPTIWVDKPVNWIYENREVVDEAIIHKLAFNLIEGKFFVNEGIDENVGIFVWLKNKEKIDCNTLWLRHYGKQKKLVASIIDKFEKVFEKGTDNLGNHLIRNGKNEKQVKENYAVSISSYSSPDDKSPVLNGWAICRGIHKTSDAWKYDKILIADSNSKTSMDGTYRGEHDYYFCPFKTKTMCVNFLYYMNLPIIKFAWYLKKTQKSIRPSNTDFIPWMDFSNTITDKELKKKFNFDNEEYNYIINEMSKYK